MTEPLNAFTFGKEAEPWQPSATKKVTDLTVGKTYKTAPINGLDALLLICGKRCDPEIKGRVIGDVNDLSNPVTLQLVEVPSTDFMMISKNSQDLIHSRGFEFYEVPESEQDLEANAKLVAAFVKNDTLKTLKKKLERMSFIRDDKTKSLAELQSMINQCLPSLRKLDTDVKELENEIKVLEEN